MADGRASSVDSLRAGFVKIFQIWAAARLKFKEIPENKMAAAWEKLFEFEVMDKLSRFGEKVEKLSGFGAGPTIALAG